MLSGLGNLWSIFIFRVRAVVQCSNDRQVYHGFVYSVDFVQFLSGTNLVGGASEDLSASDKICQVAINHLAKC